MGSVVARELGIRRFSPADGPFIGALSLDAFGPFAGNARETTLRMVREPSTHTLVATRDDERLGFVVVELDGRGAASIQAIAVTASERGRGVGRRLLAAGIELARGAGVRELRLMTAQANVEALELFLKTGFRISERVARFYPRGQDACALVRRL